MTLHELFRPAPTTPNVRRLTSILRTIGEFWWFGVRMHVAELNGLPRPQEPRPPPIWPFWHM